jgi:hypothetical protein
VPSDGFPLFGQVYVKAKECTEVVSMEDLAVILGRNFTSLYPQVILSLVHFDFMVCAKCKHELSSAYSVNIILITKIENFGEKCYFFGFSSCPHLDYHPSSGARGAAARWLIQQWRACTLQNSSLGLPVSLFGVQVVDVLLPLEESMSFIDADHLFTCSCKNSMSQRSSLECKG